MNGSVEYYLVLLLRDQGAVASSHAASTASAMLPEMILTQSQHTISLLSDTFHRIHDLIGIIMTR